MKKILSLLLVATMILSLCACDDETREFEEAEKEVARLDEEIAKYDEEIEFLEELQEKLIDAKGDKAELAEIQVELNKAIGKTPGLLEGETKAWEVASIKLSAAIKMQENYRTEAKEKRKEALKVMFDKRPLR